MVANTETNLDTARTEEFAGRLLEKINAGAVTLMISIGHRTGLFDAMSGLTPSTSESIAKAASLHERYVREWLAAMVTGGIVEYDPNGRTYRLPPEHAAVLTRAAGPDNIAIRAQYIGMMGTVEDKIVDCFRNGGGVPYSEYARFNEVSAEESKGTPAEALVGYLHDLEPSILVDLRKGIDVLDVGCGQGWSLIKLAKEFPDSRFVGYDFSEPAIEHARRIADEHGLTNMRFETRDVAKLDTSEKFDLILTFDAIHDQADPAAVLRNISTMLRPGGLYLMQDIAGSSDLEKNRDHILGPFMYTVSTMHCMTVSLSQGGVGLGTMWGEELAARMLEEAGFSQIRIAHLPHDTSNCYYIVRH